MSPELAKIYAAHLAARDIASNAHAAYWSPQSRGYLMEMANKEFALLAAALGYRIEKIEEPATIPADEVAKMEARAA